MELARYFDHTLLKPDATTEAVERICEEAKRYGFFSVCVNPHYVPLVASLLEGTPVKVTSVVGFPLGASTGETKAFEARQAIQQGADEIDMVLNIAALKNGEEDVVREDIRTVVKALGNETRLKVIIETCLLTDDEKRKACTLAMEAGAHFVKTSTGFSTGGATEADVALMKAVVGDKLEVKASGGIRDYETAMRMIAAGATRLGASASVKIVNHQIANEDY